VPSIHIKKTPTATRANAADTAVVLKVRGRPNAAAASDPEEGGGNAGGGEAGAGDPPPVCVDPADVEEVLVAAPALGSRSSGTSQLSMTYTMDLPASTVLLTVTFCPPAPLASINGLRPTTVTFFSS